MTTKMFSLQWNSIYSHSQQQFTISLSYHIISVPDEMIIMILIMPFHDFYVDALYFLVCIAYDLNKFSNWKGIENSITELTKWYCEKDEHLILSIIYFYMYISYNRIWHKVSFFPFVLWLKRSEYYYNKKFVYKSSEF